MTTPYCSRQRTIRRTDVGTWRLDRAGNPRCAPLIVFIGSTKKSPRKTPWTTIESAGACVFLSEIFVFSVFFCILYEIFPFQEFSILESVVIQCVDRYLKWRLEWSLIWCVYSAIRFAHFLPCEFLKLNHA